MAEGFRGKRATRDEDLESEFEFAPEKKKTWRDDPLARNKAPSLPIHVPTHSTGVPSKEFLVSERDKEEWRARRYHYLSMDAYSRHKALVNQYILSCGQGIEHFKRSSENDRNDYSVLAEEHKFLWEPEEQPLTWEKRLAKTYYDKLFKEYAIADLSRYKENKIAMRWRVEKEVCDGKGQFSCGNKHCMKQEELTSWEVNFAYAEHGERKNALVKLRLCPKCSKKLNYHKKCKVWSSKDKKARNKDSKEKKLKRHKKSKKHSKKHHRKKLSPEKNESSSNPEESSGDSDGDELESSQSVSGASLGAGGEEDGASGSGIWKKPAEAFLEKSKEEEFDDYFRDMLL